MLVQYKHHIPPTPAVNPATQPHPALLGAHQLLTGAPLSSTPLHQTDSTKTQTQPSSKCNAQLNTTVLLAACTRMFYLPCFIIMGQGYRYHSKKEHTTAAIQQSKTP